MSSLWIEGLQGLVSNHYDEIAVWLLRSQYVFRNEFGQMPAVLLYPIARLAYHANIFSSIEAAIDSYESIFAPAGNENDPAKLSWSIVVLRDSRLQGVVIDEYEEICNVRLANRNLLVHNDHLIETDVIILDSLTPGDLTQREIQ